MGFSIIFTIHFGGKIPLFLETSIDTPVFSGSMKRGSNRGSDFLGVQVAAEQARSLQTPRASAWGTKQR